MLSYIANTDFSTVEAMPSKVILMMPKNSRIKRKIKEKFQVSSFQESRMKNNQEQDSRFKDNQDQDSKLKKRLNQDKY